MLNIPLTEVISGKKYTLILPNMKWIDGIENQKTTNIELLDNLKYNANIFYQLDIMDSELSESDTTEYTTKSGIILRIKRIVPETNVPTSYQIDIEYSSNNGSSWTLLTRTYSTTVVFDSRSHNYNQAILTILYNAETNKCYETASNTWYKLLSNSPSTYLLGRDKNNKNYLPAVSKQEIGKTYSPYVEGSTINNNAYYSAAWTAFINSLKEGDYNSSQYPEDDDDPEKDDDDPTDPTPGDGDTTSDPIPIPPKPTIDVTNTGFVTLYNPTSLQIRDLAYFMWSGEFVDLIKKMFSAPFDCLIGLKLLYAPLTTGASQSIWLGNVESGVSAPKITDQFTDFDCGTLTLNGYFGSFLDYAPYTKVTIFLPFIGYKELNVDEVMNSNLHLVYRVDAYSGACIAFLNVSKTIGSTNLNSVLYEFDGNAAMDIPFTSGDMSRYVAAILGTAASTAGAVISMGAGAKLATSSIPQTSTDPWSKNPMEKKTVTGLADLGNGSAELISGKPHIQRGGSLAGAIASMALKQPYIIIERPMQQMPSDYSSFIGIPLNMSKPLSSFSGFTVVSQVFMASSSATDDELNMIDSLLRQGVII